MPIYEYRCNSCAYLFDALQKVSDAPLTECPDCGALELRRLISAPSFRLKGGGWYETDFKSDKERKRNLADGRDADGASEAKSDKSDGGEKVAKGDQAGKDQKDRPGDTNVKETRRDDKDKPEAARKKGKGTDNVVT